jgi:hypothetical protein
MEAEFLQGAGGQFDPRSASGLRMRMLGRCCSGSTPRSQCVVAIRTANPWCLCPAINSRRSKYSF